MYFFSFRKYIIFLEINILNSELKIKEQEKNVAI
jgi:hypothetical protein